MRKILFLSLTCLMGMSAMAQDIDAVKFEQGQTTDWYLLSTTPTVTVDGTSITINGKTYDLNQGNVKTTFGTAPEDTWVTIRKDVTSGDWNTICLEKNITAIDGATFWTISGQDATSFILDEVTTPQAGQGYIIRFTAEELKVQYGSETAATPIEASYGNPIQGTYTLIDFDKNTGANVLVGNYVVYQNQLREVEGWVGLLDHRAYVVASLVPDNAPAPAPGRARMYMPKPHQTPTGLGQWNKEQGQRTGKFLRKGQLVIVKDKKMYNAQGLENGEMRIEN